MNNNQPIKTDVKQLFLYKHLSIAIILFLSFLSISTAAQDTTEIIQTKAGAVKIERFATLNEPWGMTWLPDGGLLITEKPGQLRIYANGNLSAQVTGLPMIDYKAQGGLLDVEIDPGFSSNRYIYIYFTEAAEKQPSVTRDNGDPRLGQFQDYNDATLKGGAVARGKLEGNELKDVKIIWRQTPKMIGRGHYGGRLVFASDGKLFITSGDRQRFEPAQQMTGNLGKIVRINPDGSIPADNPFTNKNGTKSDIWSLGHRNPLGAAIFPLTNQLWIHEMGPLHGDEINVITRGKNYGWPIVSNGDNYDGSRIPDHETMTKFAAPLYYWHPAVSPSGFIFYNSTLFSGWNGNAFIGGLSSETLLRIAIDSTTKKVKLEERIPVHRRIRDVIQGADGAIWLLTDSKKGELLRLTPAMK